MQTQRLNNQPKQPHQLHIEPLDTQNCLKAKARQSPNTYTETPLDQPLNHKITHVPPLSTLPKTKKHQVVIIKNEKLGF